MSEITITLVSWNSCEYITSLISNLCQKVSRSESLRFLIIDNTNGADHSLRKLKGLHPHLDIHPHCPGQSKGSRGHAVGLNAAMSLLHTPYTLVCDPDIYVFRENWDMILIDQLCASNAIAAGAPYPDWKTGKYHDFPSPVFCFFDTKALKELCRDWSPFSDTRIAFIWTFLIRQIGRIGLVISRQAYQKHAFLRRYSDWAEKTLGIFAPDTGWKIANTAREKQAKSIVFDTIVPNDLTAQQYQLSEPLLELARHYELFFSDGQPFVVHKYGTRGLLWRTPRGNDKAYWKECIHAVETSG